MLRLRSAAPPRRPFIRSPSGPPTPSSWLHPSITPLSILLLNYGFKPPSLPLSALPLSRRLSSFSLLSHLHLKSSTEQMFLSYMTLSVLNHLYILHHLQIYSRSHNRKTSMFISLNVLLHSGLLLSLIKILVSYNTLYSS